MVPTSYICIYDVDEGGWRCSRTRVTCCSLLDHLFVDSFSLRDSNLLVLLCNAHFLCISEERLLASIL